MLTQQMNIVNDHERFMLCRLKNGLWWIVKDCARRNVTNRLRLRRAGRLKQVTLTFPRTGPNENTLVALAGHLLHRTLKMLSF